MTTAIILCDVAGLPSRADDLRAATDWPVFCVTPDNRDFPHAHKIAQPEAWLPDNDKPINQRAYYAADVLRLAAIQSLNLDADFYWWIESDVWGPVEKWQEVFATTAASDADGIFIKLMDCKHPFAGMHRNWHLPGNPPWVTHTCLFAICRLSRRAVGWCLDAAEEMRESFCEQKTPSIIHRHGGTLADLREFLPYATPGSITASVQSQRFTPGVLNHPVKIDIGREAAD